MAKQRHKRREPLDILGPTPEQASRATYTRATLAYRRKPVIDSLFEAGRINRRQFDALARYRAIADAAESSPIRDSLAKAMDGTIGNSRGCAPLPYAVLRGSIELGWLDRELGSLRAIAHAVACDDVTPSQYAMERAGAKERTRTLGRRIVTWFEPRRKELDACMIELRFAGDRLAAAFAAGRHA